MSDTDPTGCCELWPDTAAIAACAAPMPGACGGGHHGVLHCETEDGPQDIDVCKAPAP